MKNLVKVLFAAIAMVAFGNGALAQSSTVSASATATATVNTALTVTKITDINFGQIATATTPVIEANSATKTAVGSAATLGKFSVAGTGGATVKITFDETVTLKNGGVTADGELTFTSSAYRTELTAATYGATVLATTGTYLINSSATSATVGTDYIFIGGSLGLIPALTGTFKAGVYTGTFNLSATYN